APDAEGDDPDGPLPAALRQHDNVAHADRMIGFLDRSAVDRDSSGSTEPRCQRAAFDEARKPQPLIESGLGAFDAFTHVHQAKFSSFSLAKGWPSRGIRRPVFCGISRRRGWPIKNSCSPWITAR